MEKFTFRINDHQKIYKRMRNFSFGAIPALLLLNLFLRSAQNSNFIILTIITLLVISTIFFAISYKTLVRDSEITITDEGIFEKNLKNDKIFKFAWDDVIHWKLSIAKPIEHELREYISIRFKNSPHTISVSEDVENEDQQLMFKRFKSALSEYLPDKLLDKTIKFS